MTIRGKWTALALVAGGVLLAGTAVVKAADREFCEEYARAAINQARINLERNCRFAGPRWATEWHVHYDWCLDNSVHNAEEERAIRTGSIRRCTGQ